MCKEMAYLSFSEMCLPSLGNHGAAAVRAECRWVSPLPLFLADARRYTIWCNCQPEYKYHQPSSGGTQPQVPDKQSLGLDDGGAAVTHGRSAGNERFLGGGRAKCQSTDCRNLSVPALSPPTPPSTGSRKRTEPEMRINWRAAGESVMMDLFFLVSLVLGPDTEAPPPLRSHMSHAPCGCWWYSGVYFRQCVGGAATVRWRPWLLLSQVIDSHGATATHAARCSRLDLY